MQRGLQAVGARAGHRARRDEHVQDVSILSHLTILEFRAKTGIQIFSNVQIRANCAVPGGARVAAARRRAQVGRERLVGGERFLTIFFLDISLLIPLGIGHSLSFMRLFGLESDYQSW